jgi:hypothetical protein
VSDFDWRKLKPYLPVIAACAIIVAVLVTDLAMGGSDDPELKNLAPAATRAQTTAAASPYTPIPYVSPTANTPLPLSSPTAISGSVAETRDQTRISDVAKIAAALEKYRTEEGEYPSTNGNIQSACTYEEFDALCKLGDLLDPVPEDPLGNAVLNGYWYVSDGKTYTLVAAVDLPANATPTKCEQRIFQHTAKSNLYCLTGS